MIDECILQEIMNNSYISTIYDNARPITSYPHQLASYLKSRYNLGGVLVDLGCGRGDFLNAFREIGLNVQGIDAEENLPVENVIGGVNLETDTLPFDDDTVDVIFTKSVLEHIHNPDNIMRECLRILKPGGILITMVPDWQSCMYIYYDDHTHVQPYTVTGLRDLLRIYGFDSVSSEIFYQLPCVWKYKWIKVICKFLQLIGGPVKKISKNKFYRFSRELIVLATGYKE